MTEALVAFARAQFAMSIPGSDGTSKRAHLESAAQSGNAVAQAELDQLPRLPEAGDYLWDWFMQLHRARGSSGFAPNTISWTEIDAWARRRRLELDRWEADALRELDAAYMEESARAQGERSKQRQGGHG